MKTCIINNSYCTPRPCANCQRVFCAHEHPQLRSFGYYGQFCTEECQDAKVQQVLARGKERFNASRIVLIVEPEFCYLVFNRHKRERGIRGYGFKILQESRMYASDRLDIDYCHYPGFAIVDHPVTYEINPDLAVAIAVYDEHDSSMWTIVGFRLLDGEIDTFGVGGHIEVIDLRQAEEYERYGGAA